MGTRLSNSNGAGAASDEGRSSRAPSFAEVARNAAEELLDLLTAQIKLARAELSADLSQKLRRALRVALFVLPLLGGYAFAMAALAFRLSELWGRPLGFAAVAALQVAVGGLGILLSLRSFAAAPLLQHAAAEANETLKKTIEAVSQTRNDPKGTPVDA